MHKAHAVQVLEGLAATRANIAPVAFQKNRATATCHTVTGAILVRARHLVGAAVSRLVRGLLNVCSLLAALVPRREQEVLTVMFDEARAFFGTTAFLARTSRNVVDRLVVTRLVARSRVQLDQLNTEPERTERHPVIALGITYHVGIDGVIRIRPLFCMENMTVVLPAIARAARHNRGCRLVTDGRIAHAEFRYAIVNAVLAVHVENVRSPDALGLGRVGIRPLRNSAHGRAMVLPRVGVFRRPQLQIVVRAHEGVAVLEANHARVVTGLQIVLRDPSTVPKLQRNPIHI